MRGRQVSQKLRIAPEQILGDRSDPRSDLFALGVILYFLATGDRPFGEPELLANWRRRLWRDLVPPRGRNAAVPPWLQETILCCLEADPAARYATAAQLAFDLQHPDHVALTQRATRLRHDGPLTVAQRWLQTKRDPPQQLRRTLISHLSLRTLTQTSRAFGSVASTRAAPRVRAHA